MKKLVSLLCAAMLCACCVALAACGGSGSGSATASSSANPAANFVGTWKLAGGETQGMTVVGDFSGMLGIEGSFELTMNEDGTGKASVGGESKNFTWEATSDTAMTMKMDTGEASGASSASSASAEAAETTDVEGSEEVANELKDLTLEDGTKLTATVTNDGQTIKIIFTKDGSIPGAPVIDASKATPITSEADLIGEWKLSGMNLMGMTAYGESDAIAQMSGGTDTSLTFAEGGKCTMSGSEGTYTVSDKGTIISQDGVEMEAKSLDGNIIIDAGAATGLDLEMVMMYSK